MKRLNLIPTTGFMGTALIRIYLDGLYIDTLPAKNFKTECQNKYKKLIAWHKEGKYNFAVPACNFATITEILDRKLEA